MSIPNDRDIPFPAFWKKLFCKGNIKIYEFMFVIFVSLFANYFASLEAFQLVWTIGQVALLLAAIMNFQIYAKLNSVWDDVVMTYRDDPLSRYETAFIDEDFKYLRMRLCCTIVYFGEFVFALLLKRQSL